MVGAGPVGAAGAPERRARRGIVRADEILAAAGAPPFDALQATLIAADALIADGRLGEAGERLATAAEGLDAGTAPATWGEYLRLRGQLHAEQGAAADAYHDFSQSATLLELLGERYQAALSHLALGRLVAGAGARSVAERQLNQAHAVFTQLGAERDVRDTDEARALLNSGGTGENVISPADADDVIVRRIVDAAALPDLLARETALALTEVAAADSAVLFVQTGGDDLRIVAASGCDEDGARTLVRSFLSGQAAGQPPGRRTLVSEPLGRESDGPLTALVASPRAIGHPIARRVRMIASVARQGFALCAARDRSAHPPDLVSERSLEPLLPGFLAVSAAMARLVEQIQRLQSNDLTVLITGESGTGKELVARAIHVGSHRSAANFLPYNCTTTGRDLADSQLFGHRRGAFTGAVSDQPGLVRAASGGTLFLDEIGDLQLDVQPKLLRFLEQSEIMPIGETRPQRVDVRVLAATNADLEQRVAEGKFREDLYYRLSVIRIHVPPLRERREEIPHLTPYFLREASERLGKPDIRISSEALDVFALYWWPGNVRQLRNEVQRAVALASAGATIEPPHLSEEVSATRLPGGSSGARARPASRRGRQQHTGRRSRTDGTRDDPERPRSQRRQSVRNRKGPWTDAAGAVPEAASARSRRARSRLAPAEVCLPCLPAAAFCLDTRYPFGVFSGYQICIVHGRAGFDNYLAKSYIGVIYRRSSNASLARGGTDPYLDTLPVNPFTRSRT